MHTGRAIANWKGIKYCRDYDTTRNGYAKSSRGEITAKSIWCCLLVEYKMSSFLLIWLFYIQKETSKNNDRDLSTSTANRWFPEWASWGSKSNTLSTEIEIKKAAVISKQPIKNLIKANEDITEFG